MWPITSYPITPNLFGRVRYQAEIDGQRVQFARRSYSRDKAERKIAHDENVFWEGSTTFMQGFFLPATRYLYRAHDRLCRAVQQRRKVRRAR